MHTSIRPVVNLLGSGPYGNRAFPPDHKVGFKKPMQWLGFGNAGL